MAGSDHAMQSEHVPDSDAPRRAAAPKQQTGAAATAAGAVPVTGLRAAVPSPSATSLGARQVRAKSVVGAATDPAEREADHAADRALRMAAPEQNRPTAVDPTVADASSRGPGSATSIPAYIQRWPNAPAVPAPVSTPAPVPNRDAAAAGSNVWALDTVAAFSGVLGNAALVRLRHTGAAQAKKSVSEPGDAAEQQADRIAKATSGGGCCAECAGGMGCLADIIQRTPALKGSSGDSAVVESAVGASRPLEPRQRRFFEQRLGVPLDHVRVHTGEAATASADTVGARAYTLGRHMVFAAGQYAPQTTPGRELLAHELAHVAQQGSQEAAGPALVQRQAAPGSTMGPPPRPGADPQRPAGQAYYYRGVQMSSDREFMRGELRRLVARVGVRDADYWYKRMLQESGIPPEEPGGTALGITAHTIAGRPGVRSPLDIQQEMRRADEIQKLALSAVPAAAEVYPQIHVEAVVFLATFQAALGQTLLATLGESEKRLQAERIRYGITKTGEAGTTEYRAQNTVAFQGVVGAAKDLLALRQRINALWAQQHQLMGSRGKAGLFLPEENKPRYDALGAEMAKLEEQYAQELASASLRYPALGAVLDESSIRTAEERLEALASGNLTSRAGSPRMGWRGHVGAGSIGEVLDSRQQAIDKVRADVADDQDRLWKLDSIVALTKMRMGTSQLTMADKLIADKIQQIKEDAAFLAVALGVLAFALAIIAAIPTAGASLAVTATVTAATAGTLAISGYQLIKDVKEYQLQLALTNTDLNRRAQAIATEEPSMFWVALDLVSFVTDGAAALKAFQALKSEVRAALTAREGTAAAEAATRLEKAADAVPASKPGLGRKLLDSLAELRGRPEAARGLGMAAEREASAVAKAGEAIAEESKQAAKIANIGADEVKVTRSGHLVICTDCGWLRERFARELAENPDLLRRLEKAEADAQKAGTALDAATKADISALSNDLEQARRARLLAEGGPEAVKAAEEAAKVSSISAEEVLRGLPEEDLDRILSRVKRGDARGRPFGTPRNPRLPTIAEFNPKIEPVRAGDLESLIKETKHGQFPEQVEQVRKLSNEDLIRFRPQDPISAARGPGGWSLTGGHHRLAEITRRVASGELSPDVVVQVLTHE